MITGGWEEAKENMIAVWDNIAEAAQTIWFGIKNIFYNTVTAISYSVTSIFNGLMLTIKRFGLMWGLFSPCFGLTLNMEQSTFGLKLNILLSKRG